MTWQLPSRAVLRWSAAGVLVLVGGAVLLWDTDPPGSGGTGSLPAAAPSSVTPGSADGSAVSVPTPTVSPSAAPSRPATSERVPTPVPTDAGPPLPPDSATGLTVAAADALVRFWYLEAHNYLKATGDGTAVTRWSDPGCRPCQSMVRSFAASNAANGLLTGDYPWRVDVRGARLTGAKSAVVDVELSAGRHTMAPKRGSAAKPFPGGTAYVKVTLVARGNNWAIFSMEDGRP